uniref:CBS domain-containing protein n=1 Tax=Candidatus Kentrum eta TaxID=2126337 RepID=A0A450UZR5_9GAMM|nr:MAG: CBS domain-containing protein [Candidatus Kentron sp. H]VFJ97936.1 MAG: CBS domain-containing protein [Candidatus Kentron sp. H]VFK03435.1 MAG: CBS domain-containing protein [Candidatus Kentron sp. H]
MRSTAVKDHASKIHLVFNPDMDVLTAIGQLVELRVNAAPVVDDQGNIVGLLTERDCLTAALHSGYFADLVGKVSDFMSKDVKLVGADESVLDVAEKAEHERLKQYLVLEENRLIGYLGHHEILKALMTLRGTV